MQLLKLLCHNTWPPCPRIHFQDKETKAQSTSRSLSQPVIIETRIQIGLQSCKVCEHNHLAAHPFWDCLFEYLLVNPGYFISKEIQYSVLKVQTSNFVRGREGDPSSCYFQSAIFCPRVLVSPQNFPKYCVQIRRRCLQIIFMTFIQNLIFWYAKDTNESV